jgi:hypothetical protein
MQSLTGKEKQQLLEHDLVLCRDLDLAALGKAGIKQARFNRILHEAEAVKAF